MMLSTILKQKGGSPFYVAPEATVSEIIQLLAQKRIGAVLVCENQQLLGILSERDIVRMLAQRAGATFDMTARELMTREPRTTPPDTTVAEAMEMMTEGRFRHLPVVEDGELVGLVSIGDVVKARLSQQEMEVDSLRAYVAG